MKWLGTETLIFMVVLFHAEGLECSDNALFNGFIKKLNCCHSKDKLVLGYCTMDKLVTLTIQYNHNKQSQTVNKYYLQKEIIVYGM